MKLKKISALFLAMIICLGGISVSAADTTPFKNHKIPGTIKLSDFDNGGEGVAFKGESNAAGKYAYREDALGKVNMYGDSDGGAYLGFLNGNWLVFTVNVDEDGEYDVYSEYATTTTSSVSISVDGTEALTVNCVLQSEWLPLVENYCGTIKLTKGKHTLKVAMKNGGINVRNIIFRGQGSGSDKSGPYKNHFAPCVIQAEDFDNGASACVSLDGKNSYKAYRANAPLDIGQVGRTDQYYLVLNENESANYTFNVENSNAYAFYAASKSACELEISFDGNTNTAKKTINASNDYTETEITNVYLEKGVHTLTVKSASGKANMDYLRIGTATGDYFTVDNLGTLEEKSDDETKKVTVSDYSLKDNGVYKNIYVSADGDDNANGSETTPFKTISRAKEEVRKLRADMTGDIVVNILPGTYTFTETEVFNEEDGGKDGYNVIYQGIGNEKPVISGGTPVTGWQKQDNGIWVADCEDIEDTRALYIDGFPTVRARSKYTYIAGEYVDDPETPYLEDGVTLTANELYFPEITHNVEDVELVWELLWCLQFTPVKDIYQMKDGTWAYVFDQPYFKYANTSPNYTAPKTGDSFYISNALELLDEPGEFYFDKKEKKMYYYPYKAQDMETAEIVAGTCEKLMNVSGSSLDSKISGIAFRNLAFKYGAWNEASEKGFTGVQAGCWVQRENHPITRGEPIMPSQITFEYAENIEMSDCRFSNLGSCAIGMNNAVSSAEIKGNVFTDISADAVSVGHWDHKNTMPEGWEMVHDVTVENNVIRRAGCEFAGSCAISVYYTNSVNVIHNDIADVPYSGITLGWGWGVEDILTVGNNKLMYNKIYDVCKVVVDGANIYTLGKQRGSILAGNHLIKSSDWRGGIYHDQGSSYFTDYENVFELDYIGTNGNNWYFAPNENMIDNKAYNNFANIPDYTINSSCKDQVSVTNTTVVSDGNWPEKAVEIMENAGLEDEYKKNLEGTDRKEFEIVKDGGVPDKPFASAKSSGVVEAEDYKEGGEGVGYHKLEQANFNNYRHDGVWVAAISTGGWTIGNTCAGEWLEYDINVKEDGLHDISVNFSNARSGNGDDGDPLINLYLDGVQIADKVEAINTGSWDAYIDQVFATTEISAGKHTFRLEFFNNGFSFNSFKITPSSDESNVSFDEGVIEDEDTLRGFTDIKGHWAESTIKELSERGIINGKTTSTFAPDDEVSLYESIWLAMRIMGIDYNEDTWQDTAAELELYGGEADCAVSREKFIAIVMNAYIAKNKTYDISINSQPFKDWADVTAEYAQQIRGAYKLELVSGDENGKLRPKDTLTRAEAATILSRV